MNKFCGNCGNELTENNKFCGKCGTKIDNTNENNEIIGNQTNNNNLNQQSNKTNKLAKIAFILSLAGLVVAGLYCGIMALVLGSTALSQIKATQEKGKGLATAGIIIGALDVTLVIVTLISL